MPESESFQHYQVLKRPDGSLWELGRGAMGVTYKAFDTNLRCHVALKVVNAQHLDSEMAQQRFLREARAAAGLSHPNVASVFHLGESGGNYFYAMEFINGETLEAFVRRRGSLPPPVALKITLQVARALRAASREGLVHRDIKPANLMLLHEDEEDAAHPHGEEEIHVKVIDFGLAKAMHKEGTAAITVSGFVGTPHFASPEQLEEKALDVRSDIYSLGVTLWYMLVGRPPFGGTIVKIMSHHLTSVPPFEQLGNLPATVVRLLGHLLEKDPDKRPQNASDLRREIEQTIRDLDQDATPTAWRQSIDSHESSAKNSPTTSSGTPPPIVPPPFDEAPTPGTLFAGRYQILKESGRDRAGTLFQALDTASQTTVAIRLLPTDLTASPAQIQRLEKAVDQARSLPLPNLIGVNALLRRGGQAFVSQEWIEGPRLLDVLRRRTVFSWDEVLLILDPLASAADRAEQAGLRELDFSPAEVAMALLAPVGVDEHETLLALPLADWPAFQPKVFPLPLASAVADAATWTGEHTVVGDHGEPVVWNVSVRLARLAYELLGGRAQDAASAQSSPPLLSLNEQSNAVLRAAMTSGPVPAFSSAGQFVTALRQSALEGTRPERAAPLRPPIGSSPPARTTPAGGLSAPATTALRPPQLPPPPVPIDRSRGHSYVLILLGALLSVFLATAATVGYWSWKRFTNHRSEQHRQEHPAERATPAPSPPVAAATPGPVVIPSPPAETHTQPQASFAPTVAFQPTPAPTPDRANRVQELLAEIQRLQANGDIAGALDGCVQLVQDYPEYTQGSAHLDGLVGALRVQPEPDRGAWQNFRAPLERAAGVGSNMAMLFLGDHLLASAPETAAEWYRKAADKGEPEAMLDLGNLYFRGNGVAQDAAQATRWYQLASDKGSAKAKLYLAECYEQGKGGLRHDYDKMLTLLNEADTAEPNNPVTTEKLALAYEHGWGTSVDPNKAFVYMKQASDAGNPNALGNLGVYYMKGVGTKSDAQMAVALFRQGADKNNGACLFFYAQCLERGLGGLTADLPAAKDCYRHSASRGFPPAKQWCSQHKINFAPSS